MNSQFRIRRLHRILFLFCILTLSGCATWEDYQNWPTNEMFRMATEVKYANNLKISDYKDASYDGSNGRIYKFSITFYSFDYPSIEEARKLFFDVGRQLEEKVNHNETLCLFLSTTPFTIVENLELVIVFPESTNSINAIGNSEILLPRTEALLIYFGYDPLKQDFGIIYEELYEEALQLYEQQKCKS